MSSPALRDLQAGFWRSLHEGRADAGLTAVIAPSATLDPAERVAVYQTMYFWRLREVLREDFPKLAAALGDDFETLAREYLAAHPSEHPSVRHVGDRLPRFVATHALLGARPWLADLARLERARIDAFDAPDATPAVASDLRTIPPDAWADLRLEVIPALDVVESVWPVHEVWADPVVEPEPRATTVRVWRHDFAVFHAAIDPLERAAFAAVRDGRTFAEVCEVVAEHVHPDTAPAEAGALLARWIEDGLVARVASRRSVVS
jgi:hypothetical protein